MNMRTKLDSTYPGNCTVRRKIYLNQATESGRETQKTNQKIAFPGAKSKRKLLARCRTLPMHQ